uniref:T-cell receptor alpha/delta variable 23.1.2 n=1 Tax=Sinocyclocheilus anshuiensis TaxID=1608454 RepID=A0A671Q6D9_9TELE
MERCFLLILITATGVLSDSIQPKDKETTIYRTEEERVTLSCSYDTSSNYVYLYWYRQYPNREPEYLLYKGARSQSSYEDIPDRFQSATSQTSTELSIKSVTLSDSALYYCALRVAAQ